MVADVSLLHLATLDEEVRRQQGRRRLSDEAAIYSVGDVNVWIGKNDNT